MGINFGMMRCIGNELEKGSVGIGARRSEIWIALHSVCMQKDVCIYYQFENLCHIYKGNIWYIYGVFPILFYREIVTAYNI